MKWVIPLVAALAVYGCDIGGNGLLPPIVISCDAELRWAAPEFRMDGSDLRPEDLAKFTIFVSGSEEPDDLLIVLTMDVEGGDVSSWVIRDLGLRQHWFWVTVTDTDGYESAPSNVEGKNCKL